MATILSEDHARVLAARLEGEIEGEALFDRFSRGRYATDASFYQIFPLGVVIPKTTHDVLAAMGVAAEEGIPVLARGGGTSQAGQTVSEGLVIDFSKYLNRLLFHDASAMTCAVEPGITLDALNRQLRPHGVWFPVDISTGSRATIGGMAANNSCGTRSLRYGIMRDNVVAIDVILASGEQAVFGELPDEFARPQKPSRTDDLIFTLLEMGEQHEKVIRRTFPNVSRRVGGYNIDALLPSNQPHNLAELLVGSEGTLALFKRIELKLAPLPQHRALGVCHFPSLRAAMEAAQHIVRLAPTAVELIDDTMLDLAQKIAVFQPVLRRFVRGEPRALLLVEFAEDAQIENLRRLKELDELMGDLGHKHAVVEAVGADLQSAIWEVRKSALNIMMSMKSEGKPVSFVEDCAVPLEHLADYTSQLTDIFGKYGTHATWYAHASVGCLHVRPVLNLKLDQDVKKMRRIAEEAFALVRKYKGSHSGEHGDGLVRSEFHEVMYGRKAVQIFRDIKALFDGEGRLNPGKIVDAPRMDDRMLFRYKPGYHVPDFATALDWSGWPGAGGGFQGAVEMCNNNGACRKLEGGVMCPSYRVTREERDVTRGRANTLRLAISGQLGPGAFTAPQMLDTMSLCVSCKACRRECPTGVDMAKMKIEVLHAARQERGLSLHDRLVAYLPHYAPYARRVWWLLNLRDMIPSLGTLSELVTGFSRHRRLPRWSGRPFVLEKPVGPASGPEVALFADTFNSYFEPDNLRAARDVLVAAGRRVHLLAPREGERPLCCGRTFLSVGLVDEARTEARRLIEAALPFVRRGVPIVGLEPSCLLTLRDEFLQMRLGSKAREVCEKAFLFEEYIAGEIDADRWSLALRPIEANALVHGHCHQKSFGVMEAMGKALAQVPALTTETIASSCCGMAGSFGYKPENLDISLAMGELSLFPAIRKGGRDALLIANGFSCRHQIADGTGRSALHAAIILKLALAGDEKDAQALIKGKQTKPLRRRRKTDYFAGSGQGAAATPAVPGEERQADQGAANPKNGGRRSC